MKIIDNKNLPNNYHNTRPEDSLYNKLFDKTPLNKAIQIPLAQINYYSIKAHLGKKHAKGFYKNISIIKQKDFLFIVNKDKVEK